MFYTLLNSKSETASRERLWLMQMLSIGLKDESVCISAKSNSGRGDLTGDACYLGLFSFSSTPCYRDTLQHASCCAVGSENMQRALLGKRIEDGYFSVLPVNVRQIFCSATRIPSVLWHL